jgi:hypothetical protein
MLGGAFGIAWLQPLTLSNACVQTNGKPIGHGVFEQIEVVVCDEVVQIAQMGWFPRLVVAGIGGVAIGGVEL